MMAGSMSRGFGAFKAKVNLIKLATNDAGSEVHSSYSSLNFAGTRRPFSCSIPLRFAWALQKCLGAFSSISVSPSTGSVRSATGLSAFEEWEGDGQRQQTQLKRKVTALMNRYDFPPIPSVNAYQLYTKERFEQVGKGESVTARMTEFAREWKSLPSVERKRLEEMVSKNVEAFTKAVRDWEAKLKSEKLGVVLKAVFLGMRTLDSKQGVRRLLQKQLDHLKEQYHFPTVKRAKAYSLFIHERLKQRAAIALKQTDRVRVVSQEWNELPSAEKAAYTQRAHSMTQSAEMQETQWREKMMQSGHADVLEMIDWLDTKVRSLRRKGSSDSVDRLDDMLNRLKESSRAKTVHKR